MAIDFGALKNWSEGVTARKMFGGYGTKDWFPSATQTAKRKQNELGLNLLAGQATNRAMPDSTDLPETEADKAQKAAMDRLRQISQGGETPEERAQREALTTQRQQAYGEARRQLQGQISSQFEANKANMARRGIGGGGAEIAQNVAAQQATGNAMGAMGQQQAGQEAGILAEQGMQAQRRRDAATQALGEMAAGQQAMTQQRDLALRGLQQQKEMGLLGGASNLWNAIQARKQQRGLFGQQMLGQSIQGFASGVGYGMGSDRNLKTNIIESNDSTKMVNDFMKPLKSYKYEYKNEPGKEYRSVMAQDLEKSSLGKQMVTETPEGKMVDYAKGMAPMLSSIAELDKRMRKLESRT